MGHTVLGTYRSFPLQDLQLLDLTDIGQIEHTLDSFKPDAALYCAGWSWVDGCERDPERAFLENRDIPLSVFKTCERFRIHFTYLSSSYVFDGAEGPYDEQSLPKPRSIYGRSKRQGEEHLLQTGYNRLVIARTHGVYGREARAKNFVYQVHRKLSQRQLIQVPIDQFGNATHAGCIAKQLISLLEENQSGLWNVAGPDPLLRRSDFAYEIARSFGFSKSLIEPVPTSLLNQAAPRPIHAGLLINKIRDFTRFQPLSWSQVWEEDKNWIF
jgi:dTDP-4-dehydrorhamnose reductase